MLLDGEERARNVSETRYFKLTSNSFLSLGFFFHLPSHFTPVTQATTLVPEAFFYCLLANFATQTAFLFFFFIGTKRRERFLFRLGLALRSALRVANFQMKKDNIKRKPLGPGYQATIVAKR